MTIDKHSECANCIVPQNGHLTYRKERLAGVIRGVISAALPLLLNTNDAGRNMLMKIDSAGGLC